jgi:polysaccharide biosynthesis/export protein
MFDIYIMELAANAQFTQWSAARMLLSPLKNLIFALLLILVPGCGVSPLGDSGAAGFQADQAGPVAASAKSSQPQGDALEKAAQSYAPQGDFKSKSYRIGPLDVLDINVFKVPDLSKSLQVSDAGTITYPLIGEMEVGGKSARELEQELTKKLGTKYLQNPQVTVFVKEYNSQRVTVSGAVKKPGAVPMAGGMTLLQAIAQAGGVDEAAESTAVVFRVAEGKRSGGRFDLSDIQAGKGEDPQLQSGDVVVIPTSDLKAGYNQTVKALPLMALAPLI